MKYRHCIATCEKRLEKEYPSHAQAQDGELWTCFCGRTWEHVCCEAEGCSWHVTNRKHKREQNKIVFQASPYIRVEMVKQ